MMRIGNILCVVHPQVEIGFIGPCAYPDRIPTRRGPYIGRIGIRLMFLRVNTPVFKSGYAWASCYLLLAQRRQIGFISPGAHPSRISTLRGPDIRRMSSHLMLIGVKTPVFKSGCARITGYHLVAQRQKFFVRG